MFGIILIGLVLSFYFLKNKTKEDFQIGSPNFGNIIESDLFINTLPLRQHDLSGFTVIKQFVIDYKNFVRQEQLYGGWSKTRTETRLCPAYYSSDRTFVTAPVYDIAFGQKPEQYAEAMSLIRNAIIKYLYNFKRFPLWNTNDIFAETERFDNLELGARYFRDMRPYCGAIMEDFGKFRSRDWSREIEDQYIEMRDTRPHKAAKALSELHRLNIYGDVTATHLTNFRESMIYGIMFDFSDAYNIEKYLRIPYDSPTFSGVDLFFSHGKFLNDVKPRSVQQYYLFDVDTEARNYNNNLMLHLTDTHLVVPNPFTTTNILTGTSHLRGVRYPLTSMNITHKYLGKMTPTILALLPQTTRTYVTSWAYNRTMRIIDKKLEEISNSREKCVFLLERAQAASGTGANRIPDEFRTTRDNFRLFTTTYANVRTGTLPNVDTCIADFKFSVGKLIPNYGGELNLQNRNFLNNIAQKYYEYSEGLSEMIYIYEAIRIGSNMLDIRFDKQQRLPPNEYINLRNQYNANIEEYNYLYSLYYQDKWQDKYNTINDIENALSTSRVRLEPVLNPVYPVGGLGTLTSLNSQLSANKANMKRLGERLESQTNSLTSRAGASNITSVITDTDVTAYTNLQTDYNSTIEADYRLTNLINGITTGVARVFYTNGTTPVVNGMVIGINGALSYNTLYNGSIEVDIGNSPGNVNYYPQIIYTKNVTPPILCSNVDFIKRVTQLYEDNINNSLSSFTRTVYNSNLGQVFVDKVIGFRQIDSNACGFTWQETEYDYYTNKPNVRRLLNVVLPFKYDNSLYQEPQLLIDNNLANGIQIIDRGTIPLNRNNINLTALTALERSLATIQTELQTYLTANLSRFNTVSNKYYTSDDFIGGITNLLYINEPDLYLIVSRNQANLQYFKDRDNYNTLKKIYDRRLLINPEALLTSKTFYDNFITYSNTLENKITVLQNNISVTRCNVIQYSNIGSNFPFGILEKPIYIDGINKLLSYNGGLWTKEKSFRAFSWLSEVKPTVELFFENLAVSNIDPRITDGMLGDWLKRPFINFNLDQIPYEYYKDNLIYYKYLKESIRSVENMQSNREIIIERTLIDNIKLYNGYGVCQPEYTCKSPEIMSQVMEQYNTDTENNDIILRILNAYTVSPYECHYTMDLKNRSNNNITRTSKSFVITADYRDCKYYIVEYGSNNTGWFVSENQNPPLVPNSCNSQIAGYQYIGGVLSDYYNDVKNVVTPYINEALNRGNKFYNAIKNQRLDTYFGLGGIQPISIPSCSNINYSNLIYMLNNNQRFKKDIFTNYYTYNNCVLWPSKILSVGITATNIIDISFEVNTINDNFSMGNKSIRSTRFSIETTLGYCDYRTTVLSNITHNVSKDELINMSNRVFPTVNNSTSNVNIINSATLVRPTMTKNLFHKMINKIRNYVSLDSYNNLTADGNNVLVGYAILPNRIFLKVRYVRSGLTATQTAFRMFTFNYIFDNFNNIIITDLSTRNYIYTTGQPDPDTIIQYITPQLSGFGSFLPVSIFDTLIYSGSVLCPDINFNDARIKSLTGLSNIVSYIASTSDRNLCEYCIDTSPEIIPMIKRTFKVKFYIDDFNNYSSTDCNKIDVVYVVPATRENTFYRIMESDITNQTILNMLRNRFNLDNSKERTGYTYSSVLTKFYSGVLYNDGILYKVGVHYKYSSATYDINFNKVPNDIMFNNPLYIYFVLEKNERLELTLVSYRIMDPFRDYGNSFVSINDIDHIRIHSGDRNFYIKRFEYKYIHIEVTNPINGSIDLTQLQFYDLGGNQNNKISKIYKKELNIDGSFIYTEIPNINFLHSINNINNSTRFTTYTLEHLPQGGGEGVIPFDAAFLIEFSEPTIINSFSFVSGESTTNKLTRWRVFGIFDTFIMNNVWAGTWGVDELFYVSFILKSIPSNLANWANYDYADRYPYFTSYILLDNQNTDLVYNTRYYQSPSFAFPSDMPDIVLAQLPNIPVFLDMIDCITPTSSLFISYRNIIKTNILRSTAAWGPNNFHLRFDGTIRDALWPSSSYIRYGGILRYNAFVYLNDTDDADQYNEGVRPLRPDQLKIVYIKIDYANYRINIIFRVKTYLEIISSTHSTDGSYTFRGVRYFYYNFYVDIDRTNPCTLNTSINVIEDNTATTPTLMPLFTNTTAPVLVGVDEDGNDTFSYPRGRYYAINGTLEDGRTVDSFLTSIGFIPYTEGFTNPPNKVTKKLKVIKKEIPLTKESLQKYYNQKVNDSIYPEFKKNCYDVTNKNYYLMYDEYDLNRNLLRKNMVIGMKIKNNKVIDIIYYEDDDGARDAFDLSDKKVKRYWDTKIGLPLAFEDF